MHHDPATLAQPHTPATLCGYPIQRPLTPGYTFLASGEGDRLVVLKSVDEDCLLGKALHPSIVERLSRVRELAHAGVANLYGVEKDSLRDTKTGRQADGEAGAWLVWEYVEGRTILDWAQRAATAQGGRGSHDLLVMARELILSVDSLHMQGIVHGAITAGNVIVEPGGGLKLTHVSPLLYTDLNIDVESVIGLLKEVAQRGGNEGAALSRVLSQARAQGGNDRQAASPGDKASGARLRELAARVAASLGGGAAGREGESGEAGKGGRSVGWMVLEVIAVAGVGMAVAYGVWWVFEK